MAAVEQEADIGFAEVVPADDGGEGEEGEAHRQQLCAAAAEGNHEGLLCYCRALQTQLVCIGEQDDQRGGRAHQQRVDKHAHKRRHALLHGVLHVCRGMGVRGGTHAGLVGK